MKSPCTTQLALLALAAGAASAAPMFAPPASMLTGQRPSGVAFGDFDLDGDIDMAVTSDNIDKIEIYLNNAGTLTLGATYPTGAGTGADDIVASDVEADGDTDLVVVLKNINAVRVYTNNAGTFTAGSQASTGDEPVDLTSGDLDGDGDDDFVSADRGGTFTVITNTTGTLSAQTFAGGDEPRSAAIGEFTGDTSADIAVSDHDNRIVNIYSGATGYSVAQGLPVNPIARPDGIVSADLNGDGLADLAAAVSDDFLNVASVWLNTGAGMGGRTDFNSGGANVGGIAAADLDNDGDLDLVTTHQDSNSMSTLENTGAGAFAAPVVDVAGTRPGNIGFGDIDANGGLDIAIANRDGNTVSVYMNQNGGAQPCGVADFAEPFGELDFFDVSEFVSRLGAMDPSADLNMDGAFDFFDVSGFLSALSAGCP